MKLKSKISLRFPTISPDVVNRDRCPFCNTELLPVPPLSDTSDASDTEENVRFYTPCSIFPDYLTSLKYFHSILSCYIKYIHSMLSCSINCSHSMLYCSIKYMHSMISCSIKYMHSMISRLIGTLYSQFI